MNPIWKISRHMATTAALCWMVVASAWAQAQTADGAAVPQNSIDNLQVSQQGGVTIVKLTLKQALAAQPASFSVANPARIAFDFPGTGNGLGRNVQQVNEGELRSINIVQVGDRTRLVLNLNQMTTYETRLEGKVMIINFSPKAAIARNDVPQVSHFEAVAPQETPQSVRNINFRRGKNGEARITVELSDPNVGIDIRRQQGNLIVDFKKTTLPESLNRRLDVTDFATPVTTIVTQAQGDGVRMSIAPRGLWEHNAYQSDNQFVIEVSPVTQDPNRLVQGSSAGEQGEKLSLNFQNIDVRAVLQVIADFTNFNIITSDTVTGNVTLRLKDVPWDQALEIILQAKGLGMQKTGNVIWIATVEEIIKRNEEVNKARKAASMSEAIEMRVFQINYHKAEEVVKFITGEKTSSAASATSNASASAGTPAANAAPAGGSANANEKASNLSSSGTVSVDARSNLIIVNDYPLYLERIRQLIAQIDKPVRQVLIEARIVSASDDFGRSIGVRLGYNDLRSTVPGAGVGTRIGGTNTYATLGGSYAAVSSLTGQTVGGGTSTPFASSSSSGSSTSLAPPLSTPMVNVPATGSTTGQLVVSLFNSSLTQFINLEITAAENDTRVKSIASPRVITENGKVALISQGVQIPYQTTGGIQGPTTTFKPAVLKLSVTPQITPNGTVILDVDVSQDTKGQDTNAGPVINSKQITTRVSVENGGTVVLGGIYTQDDSNGTDKVPWLGDIPVLGYLFKNNTRSQSKKELLVFITPKIIDEQIQAGIR